MSANKVEVVGDSRLELSSTCSLVGELTRLSNAGQDEKFEVRDVHRFLGVPYAQPPVGDLMFKDPVPAELWTGERQAKEFGPACPQNMIMYDMMPFKVDHPARVSIDCLYLNVYTPNKSRAAKLPVMVWFHGGGFVSGSADIYKGEGLVNFEDVVYVSVGYRIGVWGFLCTGDSAATGNYGLLDQTESLRWVKKHIQNFGGDPDNVTIFGESAGGVSTAYHMVSPPSQGLFKNCISQSGTVLTLGVTKTPAEAMELLKPYLKHIGCESTNGEEIVAFLRSQPYEKLIIPMELIPLIYFAPVVDGRVVTDKSSKLLTSGNLPKINHLIGVNSDEGAFMVTATCHIMQKEFKDLDVPLARELLKGAMATGRYWGLDTSKLIDPILAEYYGNSEPGEKLYQALVEVFGDVTFLVPGVMNADNQSDHSTVYLYYYKKTSEYSPYPKFIRADHGFEVPLVFGLPYLTTEVPFNAEDRKLCRQIMAYWTNFAKTGNPNGSGLEEWPEYNRTERKYIVLDNPVTQSSYDREDKIKFWTEADDKYLI